MKNVPFIIKIAAKPLLVLALLAILSLTGFSKAFSEIGSLKEQQAKAVKSENILKSKLDTLSINEASVSTDANHAVSFLPGENPALLVLYQLRAGAVNSGLILSDLKVGSGIQDPNGFMRVSISFDVEGPLMQILDFISSSKVMAPNIWVERTDLEFSGDVVRASIDTKSFWVPFPTKMPPLTEPVTSLDASEKEVLTKISGFSKPSFVSLTPGIPRENLNPFGE
jgi:hypothetical protein